MNATRSSDQRALTRTIDGVELPAAGLWNVPAGRATVTLAMPRVLDRVIGARIRVRQGTIAIADNPANSTAQFTLEVAGRAPVPVRVTKIEHRRGSMWTAVGWMTIDDVATPLDFTITYSGVHHRWPAALFRADVTLPLRHLVGGDGGWRARLLGNGAVRAAIEIHAVPMRPSASVRSLAAAGAVSGRRAS